MKTGDKVRVTIEGTVTVGFLTGTVYLTTSPGDDGIPLIYPDGTRYDGYEDAKIEVIEKAGIPAHVKVIKNVKVENHAYSRYDYLLRADVEGHWYTVHGGAIQESNITDWEVVE